MVESFSERGKKLWGLAAPTRLPGRGLTAATGFAKTRLAATTTTTMATTTTTTATPTTATTTTAATTAEFPNLYSLLVDTPYPSPTPDPEVQTD